MNFAEAALLIQGSACVYSRKVESLYELVVLAINAITSSKNKKKKKKNSNDEAVLVDDARTFLTLDWPEEGENIDLEDGKNGTGSNRTAMNGTPSALSTPRTAMRRRRMLLGLAPPPTMLMKSTPASLYPMLHANREKAFRLSTCNIDRNTGALLMNTNPNIFSATKGVAYPSVGISPSNVDAKMTNSQGSNNDDDDDGMDDVAFDGGDDGDYDNGTQDEEDLMEDEMEDWWRPLDPHDSSGFRSRPIRKSKTTNRLARSRNAENKSVTTDDGLAFTFGKHRWTWTSGTGWSLTSHKRRKVTPTHNETHRYCHKHGQDLFQDKGTR